MFSHISVGVDDFDRGFGFYRALMEILGNELRFHDADEHLAGWHGKDRSRPLLIICKPYDGRAHQAGNGQMVAFIAKDRETVRAAYRIALAHGGSCEGPPGLRPHYHPNYYGAYFRDPDGNKTCVACHEPESSSGRDVG